MDDLYKDRNAVVQLCVSLAKKLGYEAGIRQPVEDGDWPVVTIVLPEVGEVAWHIPKEEIMIDHTTIRPYDGHSNEEKMERIKKFASE